MKKKLLNKKIIILISAILTLILAFTIIKITTSSASTGTTKLLENQEVNNLTFTSSSLENSKFKTIVKNVSSSKYELSTISINFKDASGNIIETLSAYIGNELEVDESKQLVASTDKDLSQATSIEYIINK